MSLGSYEIADAGLVILHGCRTVPLTRGKNTLISEEDYPSVSAYRWCAVLNTRGLTSRYYAKRMQDKKNIPMQKQILDHGLGFEGDHRSSDSLDNTRENLRIATHAQNMRNRRPVTGKKFKGTWLFRRTGKNPWRAALRLNGKKRHLGTFATEEEAARAYDAAALQHYGDFAYLNFPAEAVASA